MESEPKRISPVKKAVTSHSGTLKWTDRDSILYILYIFSPSIYPPANANALCKIQFITNY
jgi:hypothetical protein